MSDYHSLFHSINQLSRQLTKKINEALQPFGLYSAQWSVLYTLHIKGTLTQTELCEYLSVEAPPMTRTIQRLIKQEYVKQVPCKDKRAKQIVLTDEAISAFPKWEQAIFDTHQSLLNSLPDSSQTQLQALLSDWLKGLMLKEEEI